MFTIQGISECGERVTLPRAIASTCRIQAVCAPGATAVTARNSYGEDQPMTVGATMLAYVVSEGRLFALKPSEWSMLLGGVIFCGLLTLLFG
jgi:hypothetical protein